MAEAAHCRRITTTTTHKEDITLTTCCVYHIQGQRRRGKLKRQKDNIPNKDKAFVARTLKISDKLTKILRKDSPNEYIALVALSVVYKVAVLSICKSYWENYDKMTEKQKDDASDRTRLILRSAFELLRKTKSEIEMDAKVYKRKLNKGNIRIKQRYMLEYKRRHLIN